jgi:hypothetical protein
MDDPQLDERLCETVLMGISEGRKALVEQVLRTWAEAPADADPQQWIKQRLWSDPASQQVCQDIVLSWCFGQCFRDGKPQASADVGPDTLTALWFSGSFWRLAKAHPPGLPGGYFGHWSYPGEA